MTLNINKFFDKLNRLNSNALNNISNEETYYLKHLYADSDLSSIKELIYRVKHNIDKIPICPICGKPAKFIDGTRLYAKTCGDINCIGAERNLNSAQTKTKKYGSSTWNNAEKQKHTKLIKYGTEHYNNITKAEETKLIKYGDKHYNNQLKAKSTNLQKYGCENVFQAKPVIEKIQEKRNLKLNEISEKLKVSWCNNKEYRLNQINNGILSKYGVDNISKVAEIINKSINTRKEKYGALYNIEKI